MKTRVICTTLLIERSPQALPLGAACIASAIKHNEATKDLCTVTLEPFCMEDNSYIQHNNSIAEAGAFIASQIISSCGTTSVTESNSSNKDAFSVSKNSSPAPQTIVCFSLFVWNRKVLEEAARLLKQKNVICIAGGPEVTADPKSFSFFDYLVCGEGETCVPELIAKIVNGTKPESQIISRSAGIDLEKLESPYLDGTLDVAEYDGALWELARGCPFKCSYCYESKGEKTVRPFPMERIEAELNLFAKEKVPQVFVLDPTYNANKERALKILKLIAEKTPNTFYYFEARAEFIDAQLAKAFSRIPCALQIGLQSADEHVLSLVHRPFNKKQFIKNISILNNTGVTFGFDLIYGLPHETFKSFKSGIDFALSLYPNNLEIFCLSVLPGTDLWERAEELELVFEYEAPYHIIKNSSISPEELTKAKNLADSCSLFYNTGCAVPWFNIVTNTLKIRPSVLLEEFWKADAVQKKAAAVNGNLCSITQKEASELQEIFVTDLCKQKHMERYTNVLTDLIKYFGAVARRTDGGKPETLKLHYSAEYLESEYMFNLDYFIKNVRPSSLTVNV